MNMRRFLTGIAYNMHFARLHFARRIASRHAPDPLQQGSGVEALIGEQCSGMGQIHADFDGGSADDQPTTVWYFPTSGKRGRA